MEDCISIMMITYNRLPLTKQTLDSLFITTDYSFNLIIVDNASTDGTVDFLKDIKDKYKSKYCQDISVQFNNENRGIAIGRNQSMKIADDKYNDPYLSTIDNDVILEQNWASQCINFLKKNPKFAIGTNFENQQYPLKDFSGIKVQFKKAGNLGTAHTVFCRELHRVLGFFCTEYPKFGCEDSDYFMRARIVGYNMVYLLTPGINLGCGQNDVGEYREFKTEWHTKNVAQFNKNCADYYTRRKSCYIPFKE
jgi:GT2 family glycosyltransferase